MVLTHSLKQLIYQGYEAWSVIKVIYKMLHDYLLSNSIMVH